MSSRTYRNERRNIKNKDPIGDISNVYGFGPKTIIELKTNYNINNIRTLRSYVRKLPDIVSRTQRVGLRYHNRTNKKIPRTEATKHVKFIKKHLPRAVIAGSYIREVKKVGDLDIIIMKDLNAAVEKLKKANYIIEDLVYGDQKYSGIVCIPRTEKYRKIDIIETTKSEMPFALLYFTGDYIQNITMRQKAKKMGYILNHKGIMYNKTKKYVKGIKTEKDIFKFLEMKYLTPRERSH